MPRTRRRFWRRSARRVTASRTHAAERSARCRPWSSPTAARWWSRPRFPTHGARRAARPTSATSRASRRDMLAHARRRGRRAHRRRCSLEDFSRSRVEVDVIVSELLPGTPWDRAQGMTPAAEATGGQRRWRDLRAPSPTHGHVGSATRPRTSRSAAPHGPTAFARDSARARSRTPSAGASTCARRRCSRRPRARTARARGGDHAAPRPQRPVARQRTAGPGVGPRAWALWTGNARSTATRCWTLWAWPRSTPARWPAIMSRATSLHGGTLPLDPNAGTRDRSHCGGRPAHRALPPQPAHDHADRGGAARLRRRLGGRPPRAHRGTRDAVLEYALATFPRRRVDLPPIREFL